MSLSVNVISGRGREPKIVGRIEPKIGMVTTVGEITRLTAATIFVQGEDGEEKGYRNHALVRVRIGEARSYGWPNSTGSEQLEVAETANAAAA